MQANSLPLLSIVSPVYKAENIIEELVKRVTEEVSKLTTNFEIILVEDGSPDKSWEEIEKQCLKYSFVKGIKLSRNFGQHYAVSAGLMNSTGEYTILMDCDLQDDPSEIHKLFAEAKNGFDVVFTKRIKRKHTFLKSFSSKIFNLMFKLISDEKFNVNMGSLTLISSKVRNEYNNLVEKDRLYGQLIKWLGFKTAYVDVNHMERFSGKSSYNFSTMLKMAIQGWTFHSDKLLRMSTYLGFILSIVSFIFGIYIILQYFLKGFLPGWPSLFVAILFSTGLILSSIGIAGIYIGKTFQQVKDRPLYVIDKKYNF